MRRSTLVLGAAAGALAAGARSARRSGGLSAEQLHGHTAVVTGAGSGIGRSIALLLARRGALVHVTDLRGEAAEEVAQLARKQGGSAVAHVLDVSDPEAVETLAQQVFANGPVDLLFNNAGIGHAGAVAETPLADWQRLVDVNLMGVVHGIAAFLPRLIAQDRPAHIVNTASMAGLMPTPGLVPYSTTKAAVVGLSEGLDAEVRPHGIRVTALCPGIIDTAIVRTSTMRGEWAERQAGAQEFYEKRGTSPDVVAKAALDAVTNRRTIAPTPRYQVVPPWILKRIAPQTGGTVTSLLADKVAPGR